MANNLFCKYGFVFFLIFIFHNISAQTDHLERLDLYLVGPENVDVFHDTQSEYYIERYQALQDELTFAKKSNLEEISGLEKEFLKGKQSFEKMESLKKENTQIDLEIIKINDYLNLWSDWEFPMKNNAFLLVYDSKKCYQIKGPEFTYFSDDYRLDTLAQGSDIWWNEKVDQRMLAFKFELEETEPASEKWVKKKANRNCLSADPNDCLVWSLVETPAKYDTIVIQESTLGCLDGFLLDQSEEACERPVMSEDKVESELEIKLMDIRSGREIIVKEFEEVDCD